MLLPHIEEALGEIVGIRIRHCGIIGMAVRFGQNPCVGDMSLMLHPCCAARRKKNLLRSAAKMTLNCLSINRIAAECR